MKMVILKPLLKYALDVFHNMLPVKLWHTILTVTASFTIDIKRYSLPSGE